MLFPLLNASEENLLTSIRKLRNSGQFSLLSFQWFANDLLIKYCALLEISPDFLQVMDLKR